MTIDHLPRSIFGRFSNARFGPFGFFTGASGFVFLSGLVSAWVYGSLLRQAGPAVTWRRALRRAGELYAVNTVLFLALCAGASLHLLRGPQWQPLWFQPLFDQPWRTFFRGLLLLYRPEYLDILPMYVLFLLLATPVLECIRRGHGMSAVGVSALVWLWSQIGAPPEAHSLNPFGYQILFVSGLVIGSIGDLEARLRSPRTMAVARASIGLTSALLLFRVTLGILKDLDPPLPGWSALSDLENNGPLRLANFVLFALSTVWLWERIPRRLKYGPPARWLAFLGQHSLQVFAWSVSATYVSLALMPPSPGWAWRAMDMTLGVSSLVVPARLHSLLRERWGRSLNVPLRLHTA
jgi:hypothetical protein